MPIYEVDLGGKTYEVDAPDPKTAWSYASYSASQQPATAPAKPASAAAPMGLESIAPQRPAFDPTKPLSAEDYLAAVAQRKQESPDRSASDVAVDAGITFLKGAIGLPESFVGLADIPTKGAIGKMLEDAGYKPREAKEILDTYLSEAQQVANRKVAETKGFLPTIGAALQNPSTIATGVGESLPQMLGGASIARGILSAAPKVGAVIAGGLGEGILGAGSAAEQTRGENADKRLTTKQALAALGSGAGTAAFGIAGGKLAQKFGLDDVDTLLASGASQGGSKSVLDFAKRATGSGISEGAFEEMPQSAQEKMWMNYATDKPLLDGVPEAMGMGLTTGFAMGVGGAGAGSVLKRTPEDKQREKYERPAADQGLEALARAKGFLTPEQAAPKAEAPAPEVNLDREAELRDLMEQTARAEGKPTPAETPKALEQVPVPPVAETQQPVAEAPVAEPVAEEAPVEAPVEAPKAEQAAAPIAQEKSEATMTGAPSWVPEKIWSLHEKSAQADEKALGWNAGSLKANSTKASNNLIRAVRDLFPQDDQAQLALMTRMMEESSRRQDAKDILAAQRRKQEGQQLAKNNFALALKDKKYKGNFEAATDAYLDQTIDTANQAGDMYARDAAVNEFGRLIEEYRAKQAPPTEALMSNLQVAEKDIKGQHDATYDAAAFSDPEDGWLDTATNKLHMQYIDGVPVKHYAGTKTPTGVTNLTPITNAEEARAAVDAGKHFVTVGPDSTAVKEAAPSEAPAAKGTKAAKPKTNLDKVAHLRKLAWEKNPLMAFVADKGLFYKKGERDNLMSEFNGGKQKMISGYGPVFKAAGLRLDALLPIAIQDGFVAQDATEQDLYALIQQAFSGKRIEALYTEQGQEDLAKQYAERMDVEEAAYEERAGQSDAEWYGMDEDAYVNLMASKVAELTPEEMAELDASVAEFKDTPASNVSARAAMEALGFTEEEIQNEERRTAAKTPEAVAKEPAKGNEPSEAAPTLELETQTAEELKSKQDEIDRLTKENERLAKQAEAKAKADAERDEFVLTGSDRAADVAAAQGQKDIFGAMEEEPPALAEKPTSNEVVTFIHKTDSEPGQGSRSGHYPGTYAYEAGFEVPAIFAVNKKNTFTGSLKESEIYTMTDSEALKREASEAGFPYRQASGFPEAQYLQSLGYKAMRRGPEIIVFDAKDANFKKSKPEVASEVVGPAEKPAAPQLTREPVTIEGQFTEVGEEKQRALITDQAKKLSDAQVGTLEKFYGFARDTEEFANAARQDVVNFITKGATYVNGKIRAIIRSMANGVLSVAVAFNPQFVSMPYTIAVPQYETRIEQVMQEVPASVQKQMSDDAKRAYATIYPAIKGELQANDKFFIVADKQTANTFVFNPDGSPFMQSKTLFGAGIGDFIKGNNNIVSNRITPAGLFDLGLRDAKRSVDEAATAGEYDFGKVFVLDKSQKGSTGLYSTTIMHSVWTKEADAKQRLAALQKPGAEDSRYSFGCINVDKETYGKLVTNNLAQMDGAKIFIVPENGKDVMSFVNGEATYSTDIIRQRAEPVTKETKQEVQRAAETAATERSVVGKEEEGLLYNDLFTRSVTSEEKKRSPSFKRRMDKLNRDRVKGKISDEQFINEADWALKQAENERHSKGVAERVRGADFIRQKLLEAKRKGDLSPEAVDLAEWFIRNNEQLVDDLGVSVRSPSASGVGGQYSTMSRIIILMKDAGSDVTVVHEILHHLERMMPPKVQQAIRDAWAKQLLAAQKKAKTPAEKLYFNALINAHYGNNDVSFLDAADGEMSKVFMKALAEMDFDQPGNKSAMKLAETLLKMGAVPYQNYEYFNPSEFWAVNGADIVQGRFNAVQGGVLARLKNWLKELAQKIKGMFGLNSDAAILKALDSLSKGDGQFVTKEMLGEGDYKNLHRNYRGNDAPDSAWTSMDEDKLDTAIYNLADKHIDTKRVIENIRKTSGDIAEDWDAYTKEELYHGRTAKAINDFLDNEMLPITKEMKANNVTLDELDQYLHNRHAEERNIQINRINPDPKLKDRGSGIATKDAVKYLSELSPERAQIFESLAAQVDSIVTKTQGILVKSGMETQQTIDDWNNAYEHYVPLQRDDLEYVHTGSGISGGYATRGKTSKRATGSLKSVVDIFENIAIQRERAVMKAERARVGRALYGLAIKYPNPEFWLPVNPDAIKNKGDLVKELVAMGLSPMDAENLFQEPTVADIDKKTGAVKYVINQNNRYSENVFPIRINGQDRFIIFNGSDPRAERMVKAMKNLDAEQLGVVVGAIGEVTRFLASVNTQYNPVFGAWNFLRDVQGAALNLSTTELAGQEKQVLAGISPTKGMPALRAIYRDLRGKGATTPEMQEWIDLFEQYQKAGGATGYKDQFSKGRDAPGIVERELKKLDRGNVRKAADAVFNWLSDYNDAMENAVRLSAFKVAVTPVSKGGLGLSEDKAASIAKNLTVNFNRKGAASPTFQALYAFFNASVQGTARLAETLQGPAGRKIMAGGFMIGVAQAIALAMAGFDDDDPPEFLKNKNLIIPTDWLGTEGGKYLIVPMPMGFNIFPGVGRLITEYMLGQGGMITGAKGAGDKVASAASLILDSFNPLGSGSFLQMLAPTPADPLVAIATNRDAFGRPIAKEDRATSPTPGYTRSRENASYVSKKLAEFLNYVSSPMGTKYTKGGISPTADQLDYLAGQIGGGVSRELLKTGEYLSAVAKGETSDTPSYRVPIVGKMYGETETPAAISSKFYQNVTLLAEMENEIKSRQKNKDDTKEYRADHPESRLINRANYLENQITALNKQKKLLQEKDAPAERIKKIDEQKTKLMKGLNDQIKKIQQ